MYNLLNVSALKCHFINTKFSLEQNIIQDLFTHTPVINYKGHKMLKLQITHNSKCPYY